jgi:hypothetical protein
VPLDDQGICTDDSALAKFDNHDPKLEPDLRAIGSLKIADQICHLSQRYAATAIIPLAGGNVAIRREMGSTNSLNISRMEGKINAVIQRSIDSMSTYTNGADNRYHSLVSVITW